LGIFVFEVKAYYCVALHTIWVHMNLRGENSDEIRWQVVKAMLDEFPTLRERVKRYIEERQRKQ